MTNPLFDMALNSLVLTPNTVVETIDLETSTRSPAPDRSNPFAKNPDGSYVNRVIMYGFLPHRLDILGENCRIYPEGGPMKELGRLLTPEMKPIFVGHNLKFDMKFLIRDGYDLSRMHGYWDTQIFEYLYSGQQNKFMSLEDACALRGIPFKKNPAIAAFIEGGNDLDRFDKEELKAYLIEDLVATTKLHEEQRKLVNTMQPDFARKFLKLLSIQGHLMVALARMEVKGTAIDVGKLAELRGETANQFAGVYNNVLKVLQTLIPPSAFSLHKTNDDWMADRIYSKALFHSNPSYTIDVQEPDGLYKNGNFKYKKVSHHVPISSFGLDPLKYGAEVHKTTGFYTLSEDVLERIATRNKGSQAGKFAEDILQMRKLSKLDGTYISPLINSMDSDHIIHTNFNQCQTQTGRLSSTRPNWQNNPPEIKKCLKSKYQDGMLLSADAKQLELCGAAQLSLDKELIQILNDGRDIHNEVGTDYYGRPITDEERRVIKGINFGTLYGGTPWGLEFSTGIPKNKIADIQARFFARFEGLTKWYAHKYEMLKAYASLAKDQSGAKGGSPILETIMYSPTGRAYHFQTNPEKKGDRQWPVTQLKNNLIQGWATGDIMPAILVLLDLYIQHFDHPKIMEGVDIINLIHDDIVMDLPAGCNPDRCGAILTGIAELLPVFYKEWTGHELLVPIIFNFKRS